MILCEGIARSGLAQRFYIHEDKSHVSHPLLYVIKNKYSYIHYSIKSRETFYFMILLCHQLIFSAGDLGAVEDGLAEALLPTVVELDTDSICLVIDTDLLLSS